MCMHEHVRVLDPFVGGKYESVISIELFCYTEINIDMYLQIFGLIN